MSQFSEVGFFPYNINDQGDLVILFQRNLKGPSPELFSDFGCHINKFEPSIYFSAVRGFLTKSFGLFSAQNDPGSEAIEISHVINKNTITIEGSNFLVPFFEDIEEPNFNEDNLYLCYLSSLHELLYYTKYLVIHYICDEYLGIFYPLPSYTNVDVINKIMAESKGYTKIEFSWVKLEDFILECVSNSDDLDPQFVRPSKLVSSFDYSVICSNASKLLDIQLRALPQVEEEYDDELYQLRPLPNYGIILLEPKEYWVGLYEAMIFPWLLDNGDYWEFYHGFEGEFPSTEELNSLKGIVIVDGSGINIIEQNNIIEGCRIFVDYLLNEINPNREKQGLDGIKIVSIGFPYREYSFISQSPPFHIGKTKFTIINDEFYKLKGFEGTEEFNSFYAIKMQSTQITKLPEGAISLCKSDHSECEMYKIGDIFLSIQAHPEFNEYFFEKQLVKRLS